jgi:hypothetical protein
VVTGQELGTPIEGRESPVTIGFTWGETEETVRKHGKDSQ